MTALGSPKERIDRMMVPEPNSGCWIWTGYLNGKGYGQIDIEGRTTRAHRYSWQVYKGAIPDGLFVLHKCDVPCCVNPDHLFLGTHHDNIADKVKKGRTLKGEQQKGAILTGAKVLDIKRRLSAGDSMASLARSFGVSERNITHIRSGIRWGWLQP